MAKSKLKLLLGAFALLWATNIASAASLLGPFSITSGDNTIGVAVQIPGPSAEGAGEFLPQFPVAVVFPGTARAASIASNCELSDLGGFILVYFVFPGGAVTTEICGTPLTLASSGTYDHRAGLDLEAARDVVEFALGAHTTTGGATLQDIVGPGMPLHPQARGIAAFSNGSNAAAAVLSLYGAELGELGLSFLSSWENGGGSDQIMADELGRREYDPNLLADSPTDPDTDKTNEGKNPRYKLSDYAYGALDVDYSQLRWDPAFPVKLRDRGGASNFTENTHGILFFDGNGNGTFDGDIANPFGGTDTNGNGRPDGNEDWALPGFVIRTPDGQWRQFFSVRLSEFLEATDLFSPAPWPDRIAHSAEAEAFWADRAGINHYPTVAVSGLRTISSFKFSPHYVTTRDHAEARIELEGLAGAGAWIRANPDAAYVNWAYSFTAGPPPASITDNPANTIPPLGALDAAAEPSNISNDLLVTAACRELAERVHFGCWKKNLSAVLSATGTCL